MGKKKDDIEELKKLLDQVVVPKTPLPTKIPTQKTEQKKTAAKPNVPQWKINKLKIEKLKKAQKVKLDKLKMQKFTIQKMVSSLTKATAAMKASLPFKSGASKKNDKGFSR